MESSPLPLADTNTLRLNGVVGYHVGLTHRRWAVRSCLESSCFDADSCFVFDHLFFALFRLVCACFFVAFDEKEEEEGAGKGERGGGGVRGVQQPLFLSFGLYVFSRLLVECS